MKEIQHIGIIMDGNRRWAARCGKSILEGHTQGARLVEPTVAFAAEQQIPYLTLWAFSSENWNRGEREVGFLMRVFRKFIKTQEINRMIDNGVQLSVIGEYQRFPKDIVSQIENMMDRSKNNSRIHVNIALNYGGRPEMVRAVRSIVASGVTKDEITEDLISSNLFTNGIPDPDLIIRTGGEMRTSGFMPWQAAYSELYFTETLWPDFDENEFGKALTVYENRNRRYGK